MERYHGQFDPPLDQFLHERYFLESEGTKTIIECGAFDGLLHANGRFFENEMGWQVINIEPSPLIYPKLVENRPGCVNLNVALSDHRGSAEFRDVHFPGFPLCTNGSLTHTSEHLEWLNSFGCDYEFPTVETITFADLVWQQKLRSIELFVLDVEGHELEVLRGMKRSPILPRVLCIEHGQLGVESVREAVEPLGYEFDTAEEVNSFFVLKSDIKSRINRVARRFTSRFARAA